MRIIYFLVLEAWLKIVLLPEMTEIFHMDLPLFFPRVTLQYFNCLPSFPLTLLWEEYLYIFKKAICFLLMEVLQTCIPVKRLQSSVSQLMWPWPTQSDIVEDDGELHCSTCTMVDVCNAIQFWKISIFSYFYFFSFQMIKVIRVPWWTFEIMRKKLRDN